MAMEAGDADLNAEVAEELVVKVNSATSVHSATSGSSSSSGEKLTKIDLIAEWLRETWFCLSGDVWSFWTLLKGLLGIICYFHRKEL